MKTLFSSTIIFLVLCTQVGAQDQSDSTAVSDEVYTIVDESASFPGGIAALYKWMGKNIKYPKQAKRMGIEGRVYVQFIVNKDGSISDTKIIRGIGAGCDGEAIRVIKASSPWKPAKDGGVIVRQKMVQPVNFKLPN